MEKLVWDEKNRFDHSFIDAQHMRLYEITNKLMDSYNANIDSALVNETLSELINYYRTHFRDEECYLAKVGYPRLEEHKKKHCDFIYKIVMFCKDVSERKMRVTAEMLNFLKEWIENHIAQEDQLYKEYL